MKPYDETAGIEEAHNTIIGMRASKTKRFLLFFELTSSVSLSRVALENKLCVFQVHVNSRKFSTTIADLKT